LVERLVTLIEKAVISASSPFLSRNGELRYAPHRTRKNVFPQIVLVAGYFGILVVGVAGWKIACWLFRTLLDIPKYPPVHEAEVQQLPYYLDDRIAPPKL
jgi:hypothetical protein